MDGYPSLHHGDILLSEGSFGLEGGRRLPSVFMAQDGGKLHSKVLVNVIRDFTPTCA